MGEWIMGTIMGNILFGYMDLREGQSQSYR